jgi:RNA polymerase sigma-B factor
MSIELFLAYQATGDIHIRNTLIKMNLGLVRKAAHAGVKKCGEPYADLMGEGILGLIKAVERFNPALGNKFSSFAMPYVSGKIMQYVRDKGHTIRLAQNIQTLETRGRKAIAVLTTELGRTPSNKEVAARLGVSEGKYTEAVVAHANTRNLVSTEFLF